MECHCFCCFNPTYCTHVLKLMFWNMRTCKRNNHTVTLKLEIETNSHEAPCIQGDSQITIADTFHRRNKHKNNYKVDYQRLKDLSWDNIWVKSINTKYDKIIHFKLHTEYGYFWELFLKWTEFIPKMGIFLERFLVILS